MNDEDNSGAEEDAPLERLDADNAADKASLKRKRQRTELESERDRRWWRTALSTEDGRRILWRLIANDCHAFDERFACGPNGFPQPEATWLHAGEQKVGWALYRRLKQMDLEAVMQMHRENDPDFADQRPKRRALKASREE